MGSCQDVSNPLRLLVHPQPCCGEGKVPPVNWVQLERIHFGQSPGTCVYADLPSLMDMCDWTESQFQHSEDWAVLQDTTPQFPLCSTWTILPSLFYLPAGQDGCKSSLLG